MDMLPRQLPIAACVVAALALASPSAQASDLVVQNCMNNGPGSLRAAIAGATSGDRILFNTMGCSTITLTTGVIDIPVQELTLQGPSDSTFKIGGFNSSRVLQHLGGTNRKLAINDLTISNGNVTVSESGFLAAGGCVQSSGQVTLTNSTVSNCVASGLVSGAFAIGGGIFAYRLILQNSTIADNSATAYTSATAGGAFASDKMTVRGSTISGNHTQTITGFGTGGGIGVQSAFGGNGDLQVSYSTISGNDADLGGGVMVVYGPTPQTVLIDHSLISSNLARNYAGGIELFQNTGSVYEGSIATTITDSTISGNTSQGRVGGMLNDGTLTINNSTIAKNHAGTSVYNATYAMAAGLSSTAATLQSTIIANNTVGVGNTESDLNGVFSPTMLGSNNLVMVTLAGTAAPPGTLTSDPLLLDLADNGGPTLTHALPVGLSPAIGAGNNVAHLASDQRGLGFARMTDGVTDIGAFQTGDGIFAAGFE